MLVRRLHREVDRYDTLRVFRVSLDISCTLPPVVL